MSKFKLGDRVKCINPIGDLVQGKDYIVSMLHYGGKISVEVLGQHLIYMVERFEFANTPPKETVAKSRECKCGIFRNDCIYHRD
jgi:hypothetical protein